MFLVSASDLIGLNYNITRIHFIAKDKGAEDKGPEDDDTDGPITPSPITPAKLLQWITGQGHMPLLPFAVILKFNHDCTADFGEHSVCYPIVSACAKTISLPGLYCIS